MGLAAVAGSLLTGAAALAWVVSDRQMNRTEPREEPIVPVGVRGAFEAFPRAASLPRPHAVSVAFGAPIEIPARAARSREDQGTWAEELMRRIAALCVVAAGA